MEPAAVLEHRGGAATRAQMLAATSRRALDRALASGAVVRVGWGRYALPALPEPQKLALALRGQLSHATAAQVWGLSSVREPARVHVTVRPNAHRRVTGPVALHYAARDGGLIVTGPLRTVLDCARAMPFREALAIADSALRAGRVTAAELRQGAARLRGPGALVVRRVAEHADGRAANPFESALRGTLVEGGLTGFEPQVRVPGLPHRVDLAHRELRVVLEADSFAHHGHRAALDNDCRRYDELARAGWLVLRFSWEQVMFEATWVRDLVVDVLERRGGPGGEWLVGDAAEPVDV